DGGVTTDKLADAAVTTNKIAEDAVTVDKIAPGGTPDQVLITDDSGNTAWVNRSEFAIAMANGDATVASGTGTAADPFLVNVRADNGLALSADGTSVQLGGTLIKATV